ncbi:hypothetical protein CAUPRSCDRAFT_10761 [Caulochytrium protostelioides]|uniref:Uncharacterized protein n=1 Tax=Caulochytrium protostelioides TaxID=1555241 RepID=A0A4P9WXZ5_9FUNG|nr:hypothetical protein CAUPRSCDRAFT_10761 [Caulochytrium protostelioides]
MANESASNAPSPTYTVGEAWQTAVSAFQACNIAEAHLHFSVLNSSHPSVAFNLALVEANLGNYSRALTWIADCPVDTGMGPVLLFQRASFYFALKQYDRSAVEFCNVLERMGESRSMNFARFGLYWILQRRDVHFNRALCFWQMGQRTALHAALDSAASFSEDPAEGEAIHNSKSVGLAGSTPYSIPPGTCMVLQPTHWDPNVVIRRPTAPRGPDGAKLASAAPVLPEQLFSPVFTATQSAVKLSPLMTPQETGLPTPSVSPDRAQNSSGSLVAHSVSFTSAMPTTSLSLSPSLADLSFSNIVDAQGSTANANINAMVTPNLAAPPSANKTPSATGEEPGSPRESTVLSRFTVSAYHQHPDDAMALPRPVSPSAVPSRSTVADRALPTHPQRMSTAQTESTTWSSMTSDSATRHSIVQYEGQAHLFDAPTSLADTLSTPPLVAPARGRHPEPRGASPAPSSYHVVHKSSYVTARQAGGEHCDMGKRMVTASSTIPALQASPAPPLPASPAPLPSGGGRQSVERGRQPVAAPRGNRMQERCRSVGRAIFGRSRSRGSSKRARSQTRSNDLLDAGLVGDAPRRPLAPWESPNRSPSSEAPKDFVSPTMSASPAVVRPTRAEERSSRSLKIKRWASPSRASRSPDRKPRSASAKRSDSVKRSGSVRRSQSVRCSEDATRLGSTTANGSKPRGTGVMRSGNVKRSDSVKRTGSVKRAGSVWRRFLDATRSSNHPLTDRMGIEMYTILKGLGLQEFPIWCDPADARYLDATGPPPTFEAVLYLRHPLTPSILSHLATLPHDDANELVASLPWSRRRALIKDMALWILDPDPDVMLCQVFPIYPHASLKEGPVQAIVPHPGAYDVPRRTLQLAVHPRLPPLFLAADPGDGPLIAWHDALAATWREVEAEWARNHAFNCPCHPNHAASKPTFPIDCTCCLPGSVDAEVASRPDHRMALAHRAAALNGHRPAPQQGPVAPARRHFMPQEYLALEQQPPSLLGAGETRGSDSRRGATKSPYADTPPLKAAMPEEVTANQSLASASQAAQAARRTYRRPSTDTVVIRTDRPLSVRPLPVVPPY